MFATGFEPKTWNLRVTTSENGNTLATTGKDDRGSIWNYWKELVNTGRVGWTTFELFALPNLIMREVQKVA